MASSATGGTRVLPVTLTRYFADSRLEVESFTRRENKLAVRIEKEIGPETGIITFRQVSFMSLPSAVPGESIRSRPIGEAAPEYWSLCRLDRNEFDSDDVLFEIVSQDGPAHFVVAKSLEYKVIAESDAAAGGGA